MTLTWSKIPLNLSSKIDYNYSKEDLAYIVTNTIYYSILYSI